MKIKLSESGDVIDFKPLKEVDSSFYKLEEESIFGKDFNFLAFKEESEIIKLLKKFYGNSSLKLYFFKNILYFNVDSESYLYIVKFFDSDLMGFVKQIKNQKKIIIVIDDGNDNLEKYFLCDIII